MRIKLIEELPMATSAELYQLSWVYVQAASGMSFALASSAHFAAIAHGSNSSMRLLGWSAMRSRTWRR